MRLLTKEMLLRTDRKGQVQTLSGAAQTTLSHFLEALRSSHIALPQKLPSPWPEADLAATMDGPLQLP